ncbi:tetratricopeptide (TPR) repeat protein [Paenibacillus amylolyticus]|uniref:Tetratricopeptide (TPR) repeat protein n=1 Tax=Paenibacillus amylolyticus TaxID=1451 RepID=A0AAP5H5F7_PAEAM|nr:tetratricopeptide repeat protein [Paenibacillus amylolyticus]MDR6725351.1 tetratricopeptide (TPR) repeat protein [Paenibacillus amylolyticus]
MMHNEGQRFRFSEAPVWEWQRAYYEERGLDAWTENQVPQYITSNPMIAAAYAEMIFGFLQDLAAKGKTSEPVTILELGAGVGRLAFQILTKLIELRDYAATELPAFRYVMTDLVMENVVGWRNHPSMEPYIQQGVLDFALFDAMKDTALDLVVAGETIQPGDLQQPLLIIANYFFDSIPQELLYVGEGQIYECDLILSSAEEHVNLAPSEKLKAMEISYAYRLAPQYSAESSPYRDVISLYEDELEDSHILFPEAGLSCLERLGTLSSAGYMLITADKGDHRLEYWKFAEPPEFVLHGSFSLTANYHAIRYTLEQQGGLACFTTHHYKDINVGCILMVAEPKSYVNTRLAYLREVERFGPDDFFSLKQWFDQQVTRMELKQILPFWRLGGYDAEFLILCAERISDLLPDATDEEMMDMRHGMHSMWSSYYVMDKQGELSFITGQLFHAMYMYEDAKYFLERSMLSDKDKFNTDVLYDLAVCCYELEMEEEALAYTRKVLALEPDHEEAGSLLESLEG